MKKRSGLVGAIVVAVCLLLWYGGMLALFVWIPDMGLLPKILLCALPLAVCGLIIHVLAQRMKELSSGETDDLDQY
ncbi:MAG: hypothetical protein IJD21_08930 [Oscillospiraceae bacterium]|nr:hypothetical protein [Oscillospiraceae bacterium]